MAITLRSVTGSALSHLQVDTNFSSLFYSASQSGSSIAFHTTGSSEISLPPASTLINVGLGLNTIPLGEYSHAEGLNTSASGDYSHAEGRYYAGIDFTANTSATGVGSHAEGFGTLASGQGSHAEGATYDINGIATISLIASGAYSHAEGLGTVSKGIGSHAEGSATLAYGLASHAEGSGTTASGSYSHAEGGNTVAKGTFSHAEGLNTVASGSYTHAEGANTVAKGNYAHAEGFGTTASGSYAHAEGYGTAAIGQNSHTEGRSAVAYGDASHAEGFETTTYGTAAHAEGYKTVASGSYQLTIGQFNISSSAQSAFIIGNGTADGSRNNLVFASGSEFQVTGSLNVSGTLRVGTTSVEGTPTYGVAPQAVIGTSGSAGGGVLDLRNTSTDISASNFLGTIQFSGKDDASVAYSMAQIRATVQSSPASGNSGGGNLKFYTSTGGPGNPPTERMNIASTGVVTAISGLTVTGSLLVTGSTTIDNILTLTPRTTTPTPAAGMIIVSGSGANEHIYCYLNSTWKQLD